MPSVNHLTVLRVVQAVSVGRCSNAVLRPSQPVCTNTERAMVDQSHQSKHESVQQPVHAVADETAQLEGKTCLAKQMFYDVK